MLNAAGFAAGSIDLVVDITPVQLGRITWHGANSRCPIMVNMSHPNQDITYTV
jgi:hypothetical protein